MRDLLGRIAEGLSPIEAFLATDKPTETQRYRLALQRIATMYCSHDTELRDSCAACIAEDTLKTEVQP